MPNIGERIREALKEKGYTQKELARLLKVEPPTVSNWIRNNHVPEKRIEKLEELLGPLRTIGVGQRLRELREEAGLSKSDLGEKANLSFAAIDKIERGETTNPQEGTITKLNKVLPDFRPDDGKSDHEEDCHDGNDGNGNDGNQTAEIVGDLEEFIPNDENDRKRLLDRKRGVYVLLDRNGNAVYVGKSDRSIGDRVRDHSSRKWYNDDTIRSAKYIIIDDKNICGKIESILIQLLRPQINKQHN